MRYEITVLIPWFGEWPFWLPFYLESCRANPRVRWVLYTDSPVPEDCPENVHIRQMSFDDYKRLVSQRLGIAFNPRSPYKLCDLKPALGYLHADELGDSRFFAFSDIDLVYGDLLGYFGELMQRYDCISTHANRISGHFCLLRNKPRMRRAFMRIPEWRGLLEDPEHRFMDEAHFTKVFRRGKNLPAVVRWSLSLFDSYRRRAFFREEYTTPRSESRVRWLNGNDNLPRAWYWQKGRVVTSQTGARQFPYFHFFAWKLGDWRERSERNLVQVDLATATEGWSITADGFRPLPGSRATGGVSTRLTAERR